MTPFYSKLFYGLSLIVVLCALSPVLKAQNAPDVNPENNTLQDTAHEKDLLDVYKKWFKLPPASKNPHPENKIYFTLNPLANAPTSSGNALVTSTTANVYLGPKSTTYLSTANFAPYFNFNKRFGLPLRSSIWLKDNSWNIQGDIRFLVYPQYTWGLQYSHTNEEKEWVNYEYIRFYERILKKVKPHLFLGLGYDLDYHFNINGDTGVNLQKFTGYPYGLSGNSLSSGLTFNVLYDTRNRNVFPFPGTMLNIVYRMNPGFLGNKNYWQSIFVDVRKYLQLNPPEKPNQANRLAFWSFYGGILTREHLTWICQVQDGTSTTARQEDLIKTGIGVMPCIILKPNIAGILQITDFSDLLFFPISIRSVVRERCSGPGIRPPALVCALNSAKYPTPILPSTMLSAKDIRPYCSISVKHFNSSRQDLVEWDKKTGFNHCLAGG